MTTAEIIAAAREIVASPLFPSGCTQHQIAAELLRLAAERESVISSIDGVDLRDIDQRDNANPDQLRAKLLGAGIQLAAVHQSLDAAHDWLTEAVGDYCKPTADEPIEAVVEKLRLRCESAVKRLSEAKAALAEQVKHCDECGGTGIEQFAGDNKNCSWCKPARDLLEKMGVKL